MKKRAQHWRTWISPDWFQVHCPESSGESELLLSLAGPTKRERQPRPAQSGAASRFEKHIDRTRSRSVGFARTGAEVNFHDRLQVEGRHMLGWASKMEFVGVWSARSTTNPLDDADNDRNGSRENCR